MRKSQNKDRGLRLFKKSAITTDFMKTEGDEISLPKLKRKMIRMLNEMKEDMKKTSQ
jgi:hypothetical protein